MAQLPNSTQHGKRRAKKVGLVYVNDFDSGLERRRNGKGFIYFSSRGARIKSTGTLRRIERLVIPPAWQNVWICSRPNGHIQARGRDEAGRLQYIYHAKWDAISCATKFDRMHLFAKLLPRIRRRVRSDLRGRALTKPRVVAAVVRLLDKTRIRVGNDRYAQERGSRGATTLTDDDVEVNHFVISLDFPGKSGKRREVQFSDAKTARVIRQCQELDGQYLFGYRDETGDFKRIDSADVNAYLRSISGELVSAKDFRTWWGSVTALAALANDYDASSKTARKRSVARAVAATSKELGNTKTVCQKSYIHPGILAAGQSGELSPLLAKAEKSRRKLSAELTADEHRFARLLPHLEFT
jgi:DNA topoisomerase-1